MLIRHSCGHAVSYIGAQTPDHQLELRTKVCPDCWQAISSDSGDMVRMSYEPSRLERTALALGCAMARSFIHSEAGVKKWAAKSVELAKALLAELEAAK